MKRFLTLARMVPILVLLAFTGMKAQPFSSYVMNESIETWQPITGTAIITGDQDGFVTPLIDIGFNFPFDNNVFTQFSVDVNGHMRVGAAATYSHGLFPTWNTALTNHFAPLTCDARSVTVNYAVQGEPGSRVLIVQWNSFRYWTQPATASGVMQVRLYENGTVKFVYGPGISTLVLTGNTSIWACGDDVNTKFQGINLTNPTTIVTSRTAYTDQRTNVSQLVAGKTFAFSGYPQLGKVTPDRENIYVLGNTYGDGSVNKPGIAIGNQTGTYEVKLYYRITGPLGSSNQRVIYQALASTNPNDTAVTVTGALIPPNNTVYFQHAKGVAAGANGALDLSDPSLVGGKYLVEGRMEIPSVGYVEHIAPYELTVALAKDMSLTSIVSPRQNTMTKYPAGMRIPIIISSTNVGFNTVNSYSGNVKIFFENETTPVYNQTKTYTAAGENAPITVGQGNTLSFDDFMPANGLGNYRVEATVNMIDPSPDQDLRNNSIPRTGSTTGYAFTVANPLDIVLAGIRVPGETVPLGRPVTPIVQLKNYGVNDLATPATLNFCVLNATGDTIYKRSEVVETVPQIPFDAITEVVMNENLILDVPGTYTAYTEVISVEDPVKLNNKFQKQFSIAPGLEGTYTIGSVANAPKPERNYTTIEAAVNDLYLKSMTGPVVFELNDANFEVTNQSSSIPAIDLSSNIIGNTATNTIIFKPSARFNTAGQTININLNTPSGIGILMGQNTYSSNVNAPVNSAYANVKNRFAKANGYIIFDGGSNKNLKFTINSINDFRTVFYLGQGASNNTIKNVRIVDANTNPADKYNVPTTTFNPANNVFGFAKDQNYSAGILMRSVTPYDATVYSKTNTVINTYRIDTLVNHNNLIDNNIIEGFTYGVASFGIGVMQRDLTYTIEREDEEPEIMVKKELHKYYNNNNTISNNTIKNSAVAGVIFGFEHNSTIKGNVITNVNNPSVAAAGIMLGNTVQSNTLGYNNTRNTILANEISNIQSNNNSFGVSIIQNRNAYVMPGMTEQSIYPDMIDRNIIASNSIFNIKGGSVAANRIGISVITGRRITDSQAPAFAKYRTYGDVIANNTVLMHDDGLLNTGKVNAITLHQTNSTKVINNALFVGDITYNTNSGKGSIYDIVNQLPKKENLLIDRNVYFMSNNQTIPNNNFAMFKETNRNDVAYPETGELGEYNNLAQWQSWTDMDMNSFWYNFSNELIIDNNKIVVNNSPAYPLNSKLNNTGFLYNEIALEEKGTTLADVLPNSDINGSVRGVADARYDMGSIEFVGRTYLRDLEVVKITSPNSYKSFYGDFQDVNYIMTKAPVNVKALIRNNGSMTANRVLIKASIYREFADGNWDSTIVDTLSPTGTTRIENLSTYYTHVDLDAYNSGIANFDIGDPNKTPVFVPHTYHELNTYTIPAKLKEMATTVTPRYKIEVSIVDDLDQEYSNNSISNNYRFFIKKSNNDLLISAENTNYNIQTPVVEDLAFADRVAGKLNYDSLKTAFNRLGMKQVVGIENPYYHFDVLDRNAWEPRAIDYTLYNTMFWADGNDKPLMRTQEYDLREFADNTDMANNWNYKKSLVIASQEFLRANTSRNEFLQNYVRATAKAPNNPMGDGVSYNGKTLRGNAVAMGHIFPIKSTGYSATISGTVYNDAEPMPALMDLVYQGDGITAPANYYTTRGAGITDSAAGATTYGLIRNVVYLGQDWRHFGNIDVLVRGIFDYNKKHGSELTPVELVDFEAIDRNKKVEISWATATELNSNRFEIEKASVNESGKSSFQVIATEQAAGKSNSIKTYGPIVDNDVNYGNTYVYRLRSVDENGESSLSNEVEVSIDNFFGVSPNPASGFANYSYSIGANQVATIELYDVAGKMVKSIVSGKEVKGTDTYNINVSDLPNGTYTVVLKTNSQTYTTKLSVRR